MTVRDDDNERRESRGGARARAVAGHTAYFARLFLGDVANRLIGPWTLSSPVTLASRVLDKRATAVMFIALGIEPDTVRELENRLVALAARSRTAASKRTGSFFPNEHSCPHTRQCSWPLPRFGLLESLGMRNSSLIVTDQVGFASLPIRNTTVEYLPGPSQLTKLDSSMDYGAFLRRRLIHLIEAYQPLQVMRISSPDRIETIRCFENLACPREQATKASSATGAG